MGKQVNLTIDCRMIAHSGIGRYLENLLPSVINNFEDITLVGEKVKLLKYCKGRSDVKIRELNADIYSIKEQFQYLKVIPKCNLLWSPHYNVPLFPIKARKRIVTVHDVFHLANYTNLSFGQKLYSKYVIAHATRVSDKIITVSQFSKSEIIRYNSVNEKKIDVIYNGVNEIGKSSALELNISPFFLYVGNVKPHKNLKNALLGYLEFINNLPSSSSFPKFVIVGKKDGFISGDSQVLNDLITSHSILSDKIIFTGFIDDDSLRLYYQSAIALIFPSTYEGFGLPPLEAMKLSCPAVVSNTTSLPEVCGDAVLYIDPLNVSDIGEKIATIYSNDYLKNELIIKGFKQCEKFKWSDSANLHLKLFKELIMN